MRKQLTILLLLSLTVTMMPQDTSAHTEDADEDILLGLGIGIGGTSFVIAIIDMIRNIKSSANPIEKEKKKRLGYKGSDWCGGCGQDNKPGSGWCINCGTRLN